MSDTEIGALRAKLLSRERSDDYRQRRKDFDVGFSQYGIARDVTVEPVNANGVRAEWTATPADDRDAALLYVHGGGYVIGSLDSHRHLVSEAGRAQPACGWCISPWVEMEGIGETMSSRAETDPIVQRDAILDMAKLYLGGADPRSPLAAPIYADLTGLAPLLIQVGAAETLLDDAIRLAKVAGAADVRVDLQIWPEMVHVWHLFHPELRAGGRAIEQGGAFVRARLSG